MSLDGDFFDNENKERSMEMAEPDTIKKTTKKSTARKKSEVPTRIYSYRLLPPITEAARVEDQYRLAAQYRNALVEIEHRLREQIRAVQLAHPKICRWLLLLQDAQAGVDAAYDDLRAAKSGTAEPDLAEPRDRLAATKELRTLAIEALREAKRDAAEDESGRGSAEDEKLLAGYEDARQDAAVRRRQARTDYSARGLRHGAYARIENAIRQAAASTKKPLHFERYDGTGSIGTQLTETGAGVRAKTDPDAVVVGMTWRELVSGADPRLRLGPPGALDKHPRTEVTEVAKAPPIVAWADAMKLGRNLRRHAARTWVDLRIGSNPDRSPIFARFPVTLHRLPPKDSAIKWAYVVRRRVGHRFEWRFQLTLESTTFDRPSEAMGEGACAVNVGWRRLIDDQGEVVGLRAAYVVDEAGKEREIRMPDYVTSRGAGKERRARGNHGKRTYPMLGAIGKCDDLASIRDKALERAQLSLSAWLAERGGVPDEWHAVEEARPEHGGHGGTAPRPMSERLRGYSAWRAAWKLRRFVDAWKSRRVPGDGAIFDALAAWAKQDRHLETWQSTMRDRLIARRRETWRVIAAELARTYATIFVGESKLPEIDGWEKKAPEDGDPSEGREQRRMSRLAAPGELITEIEKAAHKTGAQVRRVNERYATQTCAACGHDEPWDAAPSIQHACGGCGRTWDQDANHCRNLLARQGYASGDETRPDGTPLDAVEPAKVRRNSGSAVHAALAKAR